MATPLCAVSWAPTLRPPMCGGAKVPAALALTLFALDGFRLAVAVSAKTNAIKVGPEQDELQEHYRFKQIRLLFEVEELFLKDMNLQASDMPGGPTVLKSTNKRYILQQVQANEFKNMQLMVSDYLGHLRAHPNSLLPRYLSAFIRKKKYWVASYNWARDWPNKFQSRVYDLKSTACTSERRYERLNIDWNASSLPTLKDYNFVQHEQLLLLPKNVRTWLLYQLKHDTQFLEIWKISNYSMSVTVVEMGQCDPVALEQVCMMADSGNPKHKGFFQTWNGYIASVHEKESLMYIYAIGMVDALLPENKCSGSSSDFRQSFYSFFEDRTTYANIRELTRTECPQTSWSGDSNTARLLSSAEAIEQSDSYGSRDLELMQSVPHKHSCKIQEVVIEPDPGVLRAIWFLAGLLAVLLITAFCCLLKVWQAGATLCGEPKEESDNMTQQLYVAEQAPMQEPPRQFHAAPAAPPMQEPQQFAIYSAPPSMQEPQQLVSAPPPQPRSIPAPDLMPQAWPKQINHDEAGANMLMDPGAPGPHSIMPDSSGHGYSQHGAGGPLHEGYHTQQQGYDSQSAPGYDVQRPGYGNSHPAPGYDSQQQGYDSHPAPGYGQQGYGEHRGFHDQQRPGEGWR